MLENDFYNWLINRFNNDDEKTANSRMSNCLRVEEFEGNLDEQYENDKCRALIEKLSYSTDDERNNCPPNHEIPIDGNIRNGTATLKSAVKLYVDFRNGVPPNKNQTINSKNRTKTKKKSNWPTWELPSDEETYQLAQVVTKYIRFLNPDIIKAITDNNMKHYDEWRYLLSINEVDPDLYLWESSPCCFPGIRRHAGNKEISFFRNRTDMNNSEIPNALKLDDNDYPKQIWSFIFEGKKFGKSGPDAYSLAHLFDHKDAKNNRMKDELEHINGNNSKTYFGLYTCPTNTAYIPNSLIRPTDFDSTLRILLFQKAESLYKGYCNILPPSIKIPNSEKNRWNIENFQWGDCVGTLENINDFLNFRGNKMKELMKLTSKNHRLHKENSHK
jgi:hypothetical protein